MEKRVSLTWRQTLLAAGVIVACALLFWNPRSQAPSWIFPYFSGAANLGLDLAWRVDMSGFADFAGMAYSQQMDYRFVRTELASLTAYSVLDKGYVYVIWVAQNLLFWLPQIKAVIWLQIFFHVASSLWVAGRLGSRRQQIIFMLAYAVNPVVLHFVTFAYHYYWQVIPALAWFWYETKEEAITNRKLYLLTMVLASTFLIRQSTIIVSLFILAYVAWQHTKVAGWGAVICFLAFVVLSKNPSQPWHTAYVGIGAYPNNANVELDDESGYKYFKDTTGVQINTAPPNGNYYDEKVRTFYYEVLKDRLITYVQQHPFQILRNSLLNLLQAFSAGYPVGHLWLAYASALIGFVMLGFLLVKQMYLVIALIIAGVAGFFFYYPPIPAYMFGNYLIIVISAVRLLDLKLNGKF